jgi:hypothetical protein
MHKDNIVNLNIDDGEPIDSLQRKEYIANVVTFFASIMKPKLENMIGQQYKLLGSPANSREMDIFIKANINAMSLLLDWGDSCLSEHIQNIEDARDGGSKPEDTT